MEIIQKGTLQSNVLFCNNVSSSKLFPRSLEKEKMPFNGRLCIQRTNRRVSDNQAKGGFPLALRAPRGKKRAGRNLTI